MSSTTPATKVATSETGKPTMIAMTVEPLEPVGKIHKPRVAKHAFSRLSDGISHPVTVRKIAG